MPGLTTGVPDLRIWITGSQDTANGPQPNLSDVRFAGNFGSYPGDPPLPNSDDLQIRTFYGGTTTFTYLRNTPLGSL